MEKLRLLLYGLGLQRFRLQALQRKRRCLNQKKLALGIETPWKIFESFWNRDRMRQYFYEACNQKNISSFAKNVRLSLQQCSM